MYVCVCVWRRGWGGLSGGGGGCSFANYVAGYEEDYYNLISDLRFLSVLCFQRQSLISLKLQSTLVISTSLNSNNCLSRSENLVPA